MFSRRLSWEAEPDELWLALSELRGRGREVLDLTVSNPTRCGLALTEADVAAVRESLALPGVETYEPSPRGLEGAREAIAAYYRERERDVSPGEVLLTSSTSEAYSLLFKLLADPGDRVLLPAPSYPLFDFLAPLDGVEPRPYGLWFDGEWHVDVDELAAASADPRARAILLVHPNNPTGSVVSEASWSRIREVALDHELAVIVDEVFVDYPLEHRGPVPSLAGAGDGLVFVLSGLSKLAALPQVKLAWIAVGGSGRWTEAALARLELVNDSYLSAGTPVQLAAPRLMELGRKRRRLVRERLVENLATTDALLPSVPELTRLPVPAGWSVILKLPALQSSSTWALELLRERGVYVHPGSFYAFSSEAYLVLSLLTPTDLFRRGLERLLDLVSNRIDSRP